MARLFGTELWDGRSPASTTRRASAARPSQIQRTSFTRKGVAPVGTPEVLVRQARQDCAGGRGGL
jgi:hypothetical protein